MVFRESLQNSWDHFSFVLSHTSFFSFISEYSAGVRINLIRINTIFMEILYIVMVWYINNRIPMPGLGVNDCAHLFCPRHGIVLSGILMVRLSELFIAPVVE